MDKSIIFVISGYILYLIITVGMPWHQKNILKNAGNCIYSFARLNKARTVLIYVFSFLLIGLVSLNFFSLFAKIILELCAILGLYISLRENCFVKVAGIYENGIICSEGYFTFDDIITLPILNLPKKEQENYPDNILEIVTKSKGKKEIVFENGAVCKKAIEELLTLCPRLKA